jgi:hypothetical protein
MTTEEAPAAPDAATARTGAGVTASASASRPEAGGERRAAIQGVTTMGFTTEPSREVTYEPRQMPVPAVPAPASDPPAPAAPRREREPVPAR